MNILLLSMSRLPAKNGKPIGQNTCTWIDENDKKYEIDYYSQLEPITRMLIEEGEIPDEVIMLCTQESVTQEVFQLEGVEKKCLHVSSIRNGSICRLKMEKQFIM